MTNKINILPRVGAYVISKLVITD